MAQSHEETIINEYYFATPLTQVFNDFRVKYSLVIECDSQLIRGLKFSDQGRFSFSGVSVNTAFEIICMDMIQLSYQIDDDGIIYITSSIKDSKQEFVNVKYSGDASNTNIVVSGVIKDAQTGESLPFASIIVKGFNLGATTNNDGYFTIVGVPTDTSTLIVSYIGYKKTEIYLNPNLNYQALKILVEPLSLNLQEVAITAEKDDEMLYSSSEVSVVKMSPKEMSKLPSAGEKDIFRSFQLLPGVSGSNESSSGMYVRGGTPDQNLILYDGFTVYHVDHLFGMFSAFNSNAVKDVQLYKGGFESKFGGRISSVMEIVGKDGNEKNFNLGAEVGLLSANLFTEIPIKDKVTVFFAARRSWKSFLYNEIFEDFNAAQEAEPTTTSSSEKGGRTQESTTPSSYFYDINAKISYKPTSKDIISYSLFNGLDNLDNSRVVSRSRNGVTSSGGVNDVTKWGSLGMSTAWSRKWNPIYYSKLLVSMSDYSSERDISNTRIVTNLNGDVTEFKRGSFEKNLLKDYSIKFDNEINLGKHNTIEAGFQSSYYNIEYNYSLNDTITIQQSQQTGNVFSGYFQDKIKLFNRLTLTPGIRASYYDVTNKDYYEPRFSFNYKLTNNINLKGAWGHYYQFTNRIIRNDISSGSRDFWLLSNDDNIPVSFSEHFILGAKYETNGYVFDIEGYYKKLDGLSEYLLQFAPSFNNVDFNEFFYTGSGTAKGIEFLIQKKHGKYNGWLGYTIGEVLYDFPIYGEIPFYAGHDVTHEFKVVNTYKFRKWTFAATWIYATGKPYTEPIGGYSVQMADGSNQDFVSIGEKNNSRYPDYHRLDIAANREFKVGKTAKGSFGVSIYNLYNRQNTWYKEFEIDNGELIETNVNLLGFMPSLNLSISLR